MVFYFLKIIFWAALDIRPDYPDFLDIRYPAAYHDTGTGYGKPDIGWISGYRKGRISGQISSEGITSQHCLQHSTINWLHVTSADFLVLKKHHVTSVDLTTPPHVMWPFVISCDLSLMWPHETSANLMWPPQALADLKWTNVTSCNIMGMRRDVTACNLCYFSQHHVTLAILMGPQQPFYDLSRPSSFDFSRSHWTSVELLWPYPTSYDLSRPPVTLAILMGPQQPFCDLSRPSVTSAVSPLLTLADLIGPHLNSSDLSWPLVTLADLLWPQPTSCDLSRPPVI